MVTIDCPFCDEPLRVDALGDEVRCDDCSIVLEFAPEPGHAIVARAA